LRSYDGVSWLLIRLARVRVPDGSPKIPQAISRARTWEDGQATVARAASRTGQPYDALTANCEHPATFAQTGVAVSPTVRGLAALGIVAGLVWAANR